MLSDGAVVEKLSKLAQKDKNLVEKMEKWLEGLVKRIKGEYSKLTPYSEESEYTAMLNEAERIQELFYDALVSAGENYKGSGGKIAKNDNSPKYMLRKYTDKQKENWKSSKHIILYENDIQFREFIEKSLTDKQYKKKIYFGAIPTELATLIKSKTGISVENYNCSLSSDEIRKIFKDHGNDKTEALRGQKGIKKDDMLNIPKVIESPEKIELSPNKYNGKPAIHFVKDIDGKFTVVAVVSDNRLDLFVQTAYKGIKKGNLAMPTGEQAPINTPEANNGTVSNDSINGEEEFVKKNSVDNTNPTSIPDIRYSARFDQHSVETALWDAMSHKDEGYDNLILVSAMPDYIVDKLEIEGDFYIYRDHAYENMVSKEDAEKAGRPTKRGRENIHFHNFGIEKMTRAILSINNPIMTISTKTKDGNPAVIMLLDEYGENKAPLYAVLSFYADKGINGDWSQRPHIVLTIAERNYTEKDGGRVGYDEIIKNAIKDGRVLDFDEKKRDDLSVIANTAGIGNITKSSLTKNIAYFKKEVKAFKEKNNILYSERNPEAVSNRSLLANALEGAVQNDIEKNKLKQYKEKIDFINAEERKLADLNRQLKELRFYNA